MRRELVLGSFASLAAAPLVLGAAPATGLSDKRLVGAWRSDRERTIQHWKLSETASAETRARFEAVFGKLVLRFSSRTWESEMDGAKHHGTYQVVAHDSFSVVVRSTDAESRESHLTQYFIEQESMYVVSGYNLEFFKRVEA